MPVDLARTLLWEACPVGERPGQGNIERVPLLDSVGRVTAAPIYALEHSPPFDRAAVDGYAFRWQDLSDAGGRLAVAGDVTAGGIPPSRPLAGQAWQVATGAPLPAGTDTVVRLEDVSRAGSHIQVKSHPQQGANVASMGEDFRRGEVLIDRGTTVRARHIGLLAAAGHARVPVIRRPTVAVVATGGEVVNPGEPRAGTQVWNATAFGVAAAVAEAGATPVLYGPCRDCVDAIVELVSQALDGSDLVITTGGASVGEHDVTRQAMAALGGRELFWGVAMKPGTAMFAAVVGSTLVAGLSGYPAAALTQFDVLIRPVLARMLGSTSEPVRVRATLASPVPQAKGLTRFFRVRVSYREGAFRATLLKGQKAGVLTGVARANGLLRVEAGEGPMDTGQEVEVQLLDTGGDGLA